MNSSLNRIEASGAATIAPRVDDGFSERLSALSSSVVASAFLRDDDSYSSIVRITDQHRSMFSALETTAASISSRLLDDGLSQQLSALRSSVTASAFVHDDLSYSSIARITDPYRSTFSALETTAASISSRLLDDGLGQRFSALTSSITSSAFVHDHYSYSSIAKIADQYRSTFSAFETTAASISSRLLDVGLGERLSALNSSITASAFLQNSDRYSSIAKIADQYRSTFSALETTAGLISSRRLDDGLGQCLSALSSSITSSAFLRDDDSYSSIARVTAQYRSTFSTLETTAASISSRLLDDGLGERLSTLSSSITASAFLCDDNSYSSIARITALYPSAFAWLDGTAGAIPFQPSTPRGGSTVSGEPQEEVLSINDYAVVLDAMAGRKLVLGQLLKAAINVMNQAGTESPRLAAHAARELLAQYLHIVAPKCIFSAEELKRGHNGNPTRRMRVEAVCLNNLGLSPNSRLVRELCAMADDVYREFSAIAHAHDVTDNDALKFIRCFHRLMELLRSLDVAVC